MANGDSPPAESDMRETQAAARMLGLEVVTQEVWRSEDNARAFEAFKDRVEAIYVCNDPFLSGNRVGIADLALTGRLPTMNTVKEYVEVEGMISYGPSFLDLYRRSADLVDKILRGAKPGDIPVEQPTRFELVINLKTIKALGLTISPTLLAERTN